MIQWWSKIQQKKIVIILIFFLFGLIILLSVAKNKYQEIHSNNKKMEKKIQEIIVNEAESTILDQRLIEKNVFYMIFQSKDGTYKSYFVDAQNGEIQNIESLIKSERKEIFQSKIKELISLKYPKFIADVLNYGNGNISYILKENEMTLYFYDFVITPNPTEELCLNINYNEIKEEVNFPVTLNEEYETESGYHYDKNKKTVALTFDDGPNGEKTRRIMEILAENKMHATFFMVGNRLATSPELVKEVLKQGNEIGSHSYNHKNLTRLKKEELIAEETKTNEIYKTITGQDLKLLRAPYGSINDLMKESLDYVFVNWNLDTEDWRYRDANHVYESVINHVEDGDIILMHDLYESTVEAVEKLLPELYARGFQVVSVSELASLKGQNLELHKVYRSIK